MALTNPLGQEVEERQGIQQGLEQLLSNDPDFASEPAAPQATHHGGELQPPQAPSPQPAPAPPRAEDGKFQTAEDALFSRLSGEVDHLEAQPAEPDVAPAAEGDAAPPIETVGQLAEQFGMDEGAFLQGLKIQGAEGGELVTLDEVVSGYRNSGPAHAPVEYTNRLGEIERVEQGRQGEFQHRMEELGGLTAQLLQSIQPENEPNWNELREMDPGRYAAERADWDRKKIVAGEAMQKMQDAATKQNDQDRAVEERGMQEFRRAEATKLGDATKGMGAEWTQNHGRTALNRIEENLLSQGFTKDEIADRLVEHREIVMVWKAARYDEIMKRANGVTRNRVAGLPRLVPSGARQAQVNPARKQQQQNLERLERTGDVRAAGKLFEALIED